MAIITKYVSVTTGNDANAGDSANPYFSIEKAKSDIVISASSDMGPHYIILSESSAAQTVYSASYGMPAGFTQEFWMGSYDRGVIVSGATGQDIIIDGGAATSKSAFVLYGSGSGVHNLTIRNIGTTAYTNRGAIRVVKRPADIRGVVITSSYGGGITGLGDYSTTNDWTVIDSCRIHMPPVDNRRAIDFDSHTRFALVNNCLIVLTGSTSAGVTNALHAYYNASTTFSTASFCTVLVRVGKTSLTDSGLGITAGTVKNCIVSMSLGSDTVNVNFVSANTATNNLYAGWNTQTLAGGVHRILNGTSASFDATELSYRNTETVTLFSDPDPTFQNIYAGWTLGTGNPAAGAGATIDYLGLTNIDLSGNARNDPPSMGCFEGAAGYGHGVLGVASGDIVKVIGVAAADIVKVTGV